MTPLIAAENYDWERPRTKRADEFYRLQLRMKGMKGLRLNREEEEREKCIREQKGKIKARIKNLLEEELDYQQYL